MLKIDGSEIFEVEEKLPVEVRFEISANGALFAKVKITPSWRGSLWQAISGTKG
jgi:hypothetical protein